MENVVWLKPEMNFRKVIEEYGYPFISKEISDAVSMAKRGYKSGLDKLNGVDKNGEVSEYRKGNKKWKFLIEAPFNLSDQCCWINKKKPAKDYEKETNRKPILGTMASESKLRTTSWLRTGCNAFDSERPMSTPMAFWTEQDVLLYIKINNIKICSVYGEIIEENQLEGQMNIFDYEGVSSKELFEKNTPTLSTTGCKRTGCMFCGYGCHLNNDNRFTEMKITHPKTYEWIMKPWENGGLDYKEVIDWLNDNGNLNIKY